jgi:hypothetical protein
LIDKKVRAGDFFVICCKSFSDIVKKITKEIEGVCQVVYKLNMICSFLRIIGLSVIIGNF